MIATGLDRLLASPEQLSGRRYGILAHAASVSADLLPIHLALARAGAEPPQVLLGPEHGFYGVEQDMVASADGPDALTGCPIVSLYGDSEGSLRPAPEAFDGLDLLLIDLQDVGSRYYTYAASAVWAAEVALAGGCAVRILDRPNPLGGERVEGNLRRPGYGSFVGAFQMPVRHGLTLAELVRLEASRRGWEGDLGWIKMAGWRRELTWDQLGRPWIPPSPNLPTVAAATIYPGACLVEATEVSEGRGTTTPFELVGAPGLDPVALADRLNGLALPGAIFSPVRFRPQYQKQHGEVCSGVRWTVTDVDSVEPFRCGVHLLCELYREMDGAFSWRQAPYEFVSDRPAIDLLTGDRVLREALEGGADIDAPVSAWISSWAADEAAFREERGEFLLYDGAERSE